MNDADTAALIARARDLAAKRVPLSTPQHLLRALADGWERDAEELRKCRACAVLTRRGGTVADDWQVEESVRCVSCPACAFTFDAAHTDNELEGAYSCPACAESSLAARLATATGTLQRLAKAAEETVTAGHPTGSLLVELTWTQQTLNAALAAVTADEQGTPNGR